MLSYEILQNSMIVRDSSRGVLLTRLARRLQLANLIKVDMGEPSQQQSATLSSSRTDPELEAHAKVVLPLKGSSMNASFPGCRLSGHLFFSDSDSPTICTQGEN